jgi:plastocyanin
MSMGTKEQEELATDESSEKTLRLAHQVSPVVERTAFWTALVMTLLLIGFTFLVKALSGILSQQLVLASIEGGICTIILVFKNRWTKLLSTLLLGYLLYVVWTEPFVVDSLSNPKGPDGGLGHFVGDVLVICCALLAFVCSLGATIQYFRGGSRKTPRWYVVAVSLAIGLAIGAEHVGAVALPPAAANVAIVTNGVATVHMNASNFLVPTVTLAKGDKLTFVDDSTEEHDLFNGSWQNGAPNVAQESGAPKVNNVTLIKNSVTVGPFAIAGTYHIFCTLHQGMELTIIVQ